MTHPAIADPRSMRVVLRDLRSATFVQERWSGVCGTFLKR